MHDFPREFRFQLFLRVLTMLPNPSTHDDRRTQLDYVLNYVEDWFSGVPFDPSNWANDGRMYPPQDDSRFAVSGHPDVTMYRTKGHRVYIRSNGAIRIEEVATRCVVLENPGADGQRVF